ncbi:MAG: histidine kinase, partial [Clostridia bacterium]|nr:histidine kinase [Clostridia bacterium]
NKTALIIVAIVFMIFSAIILLWQGNKNSMHAIPATSAQVNFQGEYRIGDGEWQKIVEGEHISSTKGDVTLRGNFHMLTPSGEYIGVFKGTTPIAFYTNHINLTFYESNGKPYVIDHENPLFGASACGVAWTDHSFSKDAGIIEIVVHNPHNFGNENAIDEMLENISFWGGIDFEKDMLDSGEPQRNTGLLFIIASLMFLGTALFSSLIHLKNSKIIWLLGLVSLFAGVYFTYSSAGISFWSDSIVSNTIILGSSMILYAFFLSLLVVFSLQRTKKIGLIVAIGLGFANTIIFILPMITKMFFYDTWGYWIIIQNFVNAALIACLVKEIIHADLKGKCIYAGAILPFVTFGVDSIATLLGVWEGGLASEIVFIMLFIVAMVVVLRIIPHSINAITKAKELETEKLILNTQLTESRVSTMMSQIRPHFIYNTLGSIEQLCEIDPPKAGELVHNFAKYLRGNFGELDNPKPILMSQEMEHVHHYISIENVRFPDMTFTFEMNSNDFHIPALTIQPIVENAIKHGLMMLQSGGIIHVVSYETDEEYCVLVEDDGVGFDTSVLLDERKHVGIRNIRGRLKAMVNGTLEIESTIGVGTKVLIKIPKEGTK